MVSRHMHTGSNGTYTKMCVAHTFKGKKVELHIVSAFALIGLASHLHISR